MFNFQFSIFHGVAKLAASFMLTQLLSEVLIPWTVIAAAGLKSLPEACSPGSRRS
jgi:hypothetical protein